MKTVNITINNKQVEVPEGTTVLDAAHKAGIHIPTLCHMRLEDMDIEVLEISNIEVKEVTKFKKSVYQDGENYK